MRTTITLPEKDFESIKEFCRRKDRKISAVFRRGAKRLIQDETNNGASQRDLD